MFKDKAFMSDIVRIALPITLQSVIMSLLTMTDQLMVGQLAEYVLHHHEKWDGTGYPKGLKGEEIPLESRIITLADAFDVMTSERTYRTIISEEAAIDEIQKKSGTKFDPELVTIFIEKVMVR